MPNRNGTNCPGSFVRGEEIHRSRYIFPEDGVTYCEWNLKATSWIVLSCAGSQASRHSYYWNRRAERQVTLPECSSLSLSQLLTVSLLQKKWRACLFIGLFRRRVLAEKRSNYHWLNYFNSPANRRKRQKGKNERKKYKT